MLVSSTGTKLIVNARTAREVYLACFRNAAVTAGYLADLQQDVAIIGAGSGREFREEDQVCCAWIARDLIASGYRAGPVTLDVVDRWGGAPPEAAARGNSAAYLRRSNQLRDLEFILKHVNDLSSVFRVEEGEVLETPLAVTHSASSYAY